MEVWFKCYNLPNTSSNPSSAKGKTYYAWHLFLVFIGYIILEAEERERR
jgi:ABC-type transport system involved in multi-copper enzyme maturation permease subunit